MSRHYQPDEDPVPEPISRSWQRFDYFGESMDYGRHNINDRDLFQKINNNDIADLDTFPLAKAKVGDRVRIASISS